MERILRESEQGENKLKKVLGPVDLMALGIGAIIGAGIFVITGTAAAGGASHIGAGPAIVISFIITGIACGFAALCYAEFSSLIPIAGSAYTYSYATLGELVAWIIGWDLVLEYMVGSSTVAIGWSGYFKSFLDGFGIRLPSWITTDIMTVVEALKHPEKYISKFSEAFPDLARTLTDIIHNPAVANKTQAMADAIGAVPDISTSPILIKFNSLLITALQAPHIGNLPVCINLPAFLIIALVTTLLVVGISESAKVNSFIVALKLIILAVFIIVGIRHINPQNWVPFMPNGIAGIQTGAAMIFFAYIGFDAVSTTAEEAKNPGRDLPIGIIGSLIVCTILYVIVAGVMTGICPWNLLGTSEPVATALKYVGETFLASHIISVGAVVALIAVLIVMQLGQPRIFFSMSRDGFVPKWLSVVHPRFKTPYRTTIISGIVVALCATVLNINEVAELCNIGTLFAFVLVCAGVIILRYRSPDLHRPFKTPLVPLVPLLGIATCVYLMCGLPLITWIRFVSWLVIGLVVYFFYGRHHTRYEDIGE
ncbi:MAG: amino acid permease [Candidatus Eremiobacteraeota bacterium]|nr:amino acid permease [Candidatus Eremiobacteraeota bacterium]